MLLFGMQEPMDKPGGTPLVSVRSNEREDECMTDKIYNYEGFGETLVFAEDLGWVDNHPDAEDPNYDGPTADAIEAEALEFIEGKGYTVVGLDG
jgi:hypothetical protein